MYLVTIKKTGNIFKIKLANYTKDDIFLIHTNTKSHVEFKSYEEAEKFVLESKDYRLSK